MSNICVYKIQDEYVVSENSQWLPGVYESEEAARYATRFDNGPLYKLNRDRGVGDDYRPITMDELTKLEVAQL